MKYQGNIKAYKKQSLDFLTFNDARVLKFIQDFSTYYPESLKEYGEFLNKYNPVFDFFDDKNNVIEIRKYYFEILENQIIKIKDKGINVSNSLYTYDDFEIEGYDGLRIGDVFDSENDFLNEYLKFSNNTLAEFSPLEGIMKVLEKRGKNFEEISRLEARLSKLQNENQNILKTLKCKRIQNEITKLKKRMASDYEYICNFKNEELNLINDFFNSVKEYHKFEVDYRNCNYLERASQLKEAYDGIMLSHIKEMIVTNKTTLDEAKYVFNRYSCFRITPRLAKKWLPLVNENVFQCVNWIRTRQHILGLIEEIDEAIELHRLYVDGVDIDKYIKIKEKVNYEYTKH